MKKGLLIYNPEDYQKNKWFVRELLTQAPKHGLKLDFILRNHLSLSLDQTGNFTACGILDTIPFSTPGALESLTPDSKTSFEPVSLTDFDFVINRTRDSLIGRHFENMGYQVFNNANITEICNHKGKTHQFINRCSIPSVATLFGNVHYFNPVLIPFGYPLILKSVSGHGGSEVFYIEDETSLMSHLDNLPTEDFILQELCTNPGTDIRVFALGQEIVASVKRFCPTSFKSNYSLGGSAMPYTLLTHEEAMVRQILYLLESDFVGIDFILDQDNQLLFNEIEDVVGTRTLYLNYPDIDIVDRFLYYIKKTLR